MLTQQPQQVVPRQRVVVRRAAPHITSSHVQTVPCAPNRRSYVVSSSSTCAPVQAMGRVYTRVNVAGDTRRIATGSLSVPQTTVVAPPLTTVVTPVLQQVCKPVWHSYPMVVSANATAPLTNESSGRIRFVKDQQTQHGLCMQDLPRELMQDIADWLPTFQARAQLRALFREVRGLEWRCAAPLYVDEELSGFDLGDVGISAVSAGLRVPRNAVLKELCLGSNNVTDQGAKALAEILTSAGTKLRRLSLRDNCISDAGAEALAAALARNSTLEELDLWGNCLSEKGKQTLVSAAQCEVFLELPQQCAQATTPKRNVFDSRVRAILFDWISQVHVSAAAAVETAPDPQDMLFRTFSHMDAYLRHLPRHAQRAELQLVGVACTLVATGLEAKDSDSPECTELANWLALTTDGACTSDEVREAAREVRAKLGSRLHQPTAYTFLRRYLRQTGWTEKSFSLANYLIELAALDSSFLEYRPQAIAAAAAVLSRQYASQGINRCHMPHWKAKLMRCAHLDLQQELAPCAAAMSRLHAAQHSHVANIFVNKKYEWSRLHSVAKLRPNPPSHMAYFASYLSADTDVATTSDNQ